jgi:uncharacterized protein (DUF2236 family)
MVWRLYTEAMLSTSAASLHDLAAARRVHANAALLVGGGRALLMQLAHPMVARGVAEHSAFTHDPITRLVRTLRLTLTLVYGNDDEVERALDAINGVHQRVAGPGYAASDPALLLWVHATLIDTALRMHALLVRPLNDVEAAAYYQDMQRIGAALGIPCEAFPPDMSSFSTYLSAMNQTLQVSDAARSLAHEIFRPRGVITPALFVTRALTAGLLPEPLRLQYGMSWGPRRQAGLGASAKLSRAVHPWLPRVLKQTPAFLLPKGARITTH